MAAANRSTAACPVRNCALSRRSAHRERTESFVSYGTSCGMRRQSSIPAESAKQQPQSTSRPRMPRCSSRTAPSRGTEKLVHGIHQLDDCVAAQQLGAVQQQRQAGAYHGRVKPLNGVQTAQHGQDQRKQGQMRQSGSGSSRNTGGHQIQQCHQAGFTAAVCQRAAGQHSSKGGQHGQSGDAAVQRGRTSLPQQIQRQRKPQGGIAEQGRRSVRGR